MLIASDVLNLNVYVLLNSDNFYLLWTSHRNLNLEWQAWIINGLGTGCH